MIAFPRLAKYSPHPHQCLRLALTPVRLIKSRGGLTGSKVLPSNE